MSLPSLANLPATLLPAAERAGTALRSAVAALDAAALARLEAWPEAPGDFRRVAAASDFVAEQAVRDPAMLLELAERGELENPRRPANCAVSCRRGWRIAPTRTNSVGACDVSAHASNCASSGAT